MSQYKSLSEEKADELEKAKKRFFPYFGESEIELLKANLFYLHLKEYTKVQYNPHMKPLTWALGVMHNRPNTIITQQNMDDLCKHQKKAFRFLLLFKEACPDTLKEKIFRSGLDECIANAGILKRPIIIEFKQFINRTDRNQPLSDFISPEEEKILHQNRTGYFLSHFQSEWKKTSQTAQLSVKAMNRVDRQEFSMNEYTKDYKKMYGLAALGYYKMPEGIFNNVSTLFSGTVTKVSYTALKQRAVEFLERYFLEGSCDIKGEPQTNILFFDALFTGRLGKISSSLYLADEMSKKSDTFARCYTAYKKTLPKERLYDLEDMAVAYTCAH